MNTPNETETYVILCHGQFAGCRKTLASAQSAVRRLNKDAFGAQVATIMIGQDPRKNGGEWNLRPLS